MEDTLQAQIKNLRKICNFYSKSFHFHLI